MGLGLGSYLGILVFLMTTVIFGAGSREPGGGIVKVDLQNNTTKVVQQEKQ